MGPGRAMKTLVWILMDFLLFLTPLPPISMLHTVIQRSGRAKKTLLFNMPRSMIIFVRNLEIGGVGVDYGDHRNYGGAFSSHDPE